MAIVIVCYLFRHEVGFQENTRKEETNNGGVKISLTCSFTLFLKKYYKCCECFCLFVFFFFFSLSFFYNLEFHFFPAGCVFFGQFNINKVM